jgi:hypothetical protein
MSNMTRTKRFILALSFAVLAASVCGAREMTTAQAAALYQKISDGKMVEITTDPTLTEDEFFQQIAELAQIIISYNVHCRKPSPRESDFEAVFNGSWAYLSYSHKAEKFKKDAYEVVENRIALTGEKTWCVEFAPIVDHRFR